MDFNIGIRRATFEDSRGIHESHMRSVSEVCCHDYTEEQIRAWGSAPYKESVRNSHIEKDFVWVVEANNQICGYSHLRKIVKETEVIGYVMGLYLEPKVLRKGLGARLLQIMESEARAVGATKMALDSTKTALNFYRVQGFRDIGEFQPIMIGGVGVEAIYMEKSLL